MKKVHSNYSVFLLLLFGIIAFETIQQRYYIINFQQPEIIPSFFDLLINHVWRWVVLMLSAIPLIIYSNRLAIKPILQWRFTERLIISIYFLSTVFTALLIISAFSFYIQNNGEGLLFGYIEFFLYQQTAFFILALILIVMITAFNHQSQIIENQ